MFMLEDKSNSKLVTYALYGPPVWLDAFSQFELNFKIATQFFFQDTFKMHFKGSSVQETGTLFQLRNALGI
jgi:hypothetical protein